MTIIEVLFSYLRLCTISSLLLCNNYKKCNRFSYNLNNTNKSHNIKMGQNHHSATTDNKKNTSKSLSQGCIFDKSTSDNEINIETHISSTRIHNRH